MGNWQLEVGKMFVYMTFPVGVFFYFNQPKYFEQWVTKTKREIFPPDNTTQEILLRKGIKDIQMKQEAQRLDALEMQKT